MIDGLDGHGASTPAGAPAHRRERYTLDVHYSEPFIGTETAFTLSVHCSEWYTLRVWRRSMCVCTCWCARTMAIKASGNRGWYPRSVGSRATAALLLEVMGCRVR